MKSLVGLIRLNFIIIRVLIATHFGQSGGSFVTFLQITSFARKGREESLFCRLNK